MFNAWTYERGNMVTFSSTESVLQSSKERDFNIDKQDYHHNHNHVRKFFEFFWVIKLLLIRFVINTVQDILIDYCKIDLQVDLTS